MSDARYFHNSLPHQVRVSTGNSLARCSTQAGVTSLVIGMTNAALPLRVFVWLMLTSTGTALERGVCARPVHTDQNNTSNSKTRNPLKHVLNFKFIAPEITNN